MTDWRTTTLDQLGRIVTGATPRSNVQGYFDGNIPFITPSDMDGRRTIEATSRYLTEEGANATGRSRIPKNAVMVSCIGSDMGKAAVTDRESVTNQQINSIIVGGAADPTYVYYDLSRRKDEIRLSAGGSAQPILNKSAFGQLTIRLPPLEMQRAIACVLGALDDKIEQNRRTAQTLERLARAIFRAWFVDFEPVKAKAAGATSFPSMPQPVFDALPTKFIGPVPEGWSPGSLGTIAHEVRDGAKPYEIDPETPYLGLEHMPKRCIALSEWGSVSEVTSTKTRFRAGHILFGKLRPYFHKVGIAPIDGVCSTDIVVVEALQPQYFGIVLGLISSDAFVAHTNACASGTKMPRTKWADMKMYPLAIPPAAIAEAFNAVMQPMARKIVTDIHESRKLAEMRDYLLPKLLSGTVRITKPTLETVE